MKTKVIPFIETTFVTKLQPGDVFSFKDDVGILHQNQVFPYAHNQFFMCVSIHEVKFIDIDAVESVKVLHMIAIINSTHEHAKYHGQIMTMNMYNFVNVSKASKRKLMKKVRIYIKG
jgi:hypothetical protein